MRRDIKSMSSAGECIRPNNAPDHHAQIGLPDISCAIKWMGSRAFGPAKQYGPRLLSIVPQGMIRFQIGFFLLMVTSAALCGHRALKTLLSVILHQPKLWRGGVTSTSHIITCATLSHIR